MAYKYLSEPIVLYFTLPDNLKGTNVSYTVTDEATGVPLYNGSVYATGGQQSLVLNDIASLNLDTYDWFRNPDSNNKHTTKVIDNAPVFGTLVVSFENDLTYEIPDIVYGYNYPNASGSIDVPPEGDNRLVTINDWGTGIIPRIPFIKSAVSPFFMMMSYIYPNSSFTNANSVVLGLFDENDTKLVNLATTSISTDPTVTKILYGPSHINTMMLYKNDNVKFIAAALTRTGGSILVTPFKVVAYVDREPADYYISWINRFGTWQCQPMCAKWEMTEKVTTESITTVRNETIPHTTTSEYSWTLNSHWLNYAEHEEFESLLHSKYIYLYSPKYNEGHFVNITDSNWTFKNEVNTKKPFNLTVNLTKSQKQNVIL